MSIERLVYKPGESLQIDFKMSDEKQPIIDDIVSVEELQKMLIDKTQENVALQDEIVKMKTRAIKVYEENQMLKVSPQYALQAAEMKMQLEMAELFLKSGALPKGIQNTSQVYVMIKAGAEMGMEPLESVNSLYFVHGKIEPYGKGMTALLTKAGYKLTYQEDKEKCVLTATGSDGEVYQETAYAKDPIIMKSNAAKISLRNKLRFHAIRTLLNFQLPHLIAGSADLFESTHIELATDENGNTVQTVSSEDLLNLIQGAKSVDELNKINEDHGAVISKDIQLVSAFGKARKTLEDGK